MKGVTCFGPVGGFQVMSVLTVLAGIGAIVLGIVGVTRTRRRGGSKAMFIVSIILAPFLIGAGALFLGVLANLS